MEEHLLRRGQLRVREDDDGDPEASLAASAVSDQAPPAGPQWVIRLRPPEPKALAYDQPLCASKDGFTLHAATRAGALDAPGREALLRYVLRPPIAQDKVEHRPDGLVCIILEALRRWHRRCGHGSAVPAQPAGRERSSASPPHRPLRRGFGAASQWRSRIVPPAEPEAPGPERPGEKKLKCGYRTWAELLARTFRHRRARLSSLPGAHEADRRPQKPVSIARYLTGNGEPMELPARSPDRGPPHWKSTILRRQALGYEEA
jgi:hypothetical protein